MVEAVAEPNFIGTLGLNWKLFLAQLLNFGVVLFVLWRWVFRPLSGALEQRRLKIEGSVKKAEEIEARLNLLAVERKETMQKARQEADGIIKDALTAASNIKTEGEAAARAQSEKILNDTKVEINAEKDRALKEVKTEIATIVIAAAEKVARVKIDSKQDMDLTNEIIE